MLEYIPVPADHRRSLSTQTVLVTDNIAGVVLSEYILIHPQWLRRMRRLATSELYVYTNHRRNSIATTARYELYCRQSTPTPRETIPCFGPMLSNCSIRAVPAIP